MKTSVIIATNKRNRQLRFNLLSLSTQKFPFEVLVLDDCFIEDVECKQLVDSFSSSLDVSYIHSGKTKKGMDFWRVPGFSYNIGVKLAKGDGIIISCSEMYHIGATIEGLSEPLGGNGKIYTCPQFVYDDKGVILNRLEKKLPINEENYKAFRALRAYYPFLIGLKKEDYVAIGGYDEDFTGIAYDDRDFIERLLAYGLKAKTISCQAIHLFHGPHTKYNNPRGEYNKKMLLSRKNIIERNVGKNWGEL